VILEPVAAGRAKAAARKCIGDRRQSPLARAADVSQSTLTKIADGSRGVADDVEHKIIEALLAEVARMEGAALRVSALVGKILDAREK
jgi:hypothetical protein